MTTTEQIPPLPGAISLSHLKVYDTPGPDGLCGGSPHLHFACTEAYLVTAGNGAVQTMSIDGFREVPLTPGSLLWFTPGLVHRLINHGDLEIFVIMANAGLPESGDFVLTFPEVYLRDQNAYLQAASLHESGAVYAHTVEASRRRRDLAVEGFLTLRHRFEREGPGVVRDFYHLALQRVGSKARDWRHLWKTGPLAEANRTGACLEDLENGRAAYLESGDIFRFAIDPGRERRLGFCGTLQPYLPEGALLTA